MDTKKMIKVLIGICVVLILLVVILMFVIGKNKDNNVAVVNSMENSNENTNRIQNNNIQNNIRNDISNNININQNNVIGENIVNENVTNNNQTNNNTTNNNTSNNNNSNNNITENVIDDTGILNNQAQNNEQNANAEIELEGITPKETTRTAIINTIQNCIKTYLRYVNTNNSNAVYSILDTTYIEENNITQNNVLNNVPNYNIDGNTSQINEIYGVTGSTYSIYYVRYQLGNSYIFFTVHMDIETDSFSIIPIGSNTYNTSIVTPSEGISKSATISSNQYNKVTYSR